MSNITSATGPSLYTNIATLGANQAKPRPQQPNPPKQPENIDSVKISPEALIQSAKETRTLPKITQGNDSTSQGQKTQRPAETTNQDKPSQRSVQLVDNKLFTTYKPVPSGTGGNAIIKKFNIKDQQQLPPPEEPSRAAQNLLQNLSAGNDNDSRTPGTQYRLTPKVI
ncbi:MAG: hypothetical protein KKE17_08395 [Proteobacteria bacterium]|nr:hypothetical protein [Pseudomonadota bacterium]MBU1710007.1 hypothetical protein [Pseudomonadota bacterium]